ncbi:hypothetical protein [Marisediminicola sp. LYQ85]|uniref:hypothetical protein n=1 Tax=Marisediminicola sp. LYQ85 TaxID=3391062 RepID=UPI0039832496
MRFVLAIVSLVIAVVLAGYGVAQRTVLADPDSLTASVQTTGDATVTVIDGATLDALEGRQSVALAGSDTVFASYGRTGDVLAWIGDTSYNTVTFDAETQSLESSVVEGEEIEVPSPAGSDLWLREYEGEGSLDMQMSLNDELSLLVVSDGVAPAPTDVSITWPLDNRTPWAGPLILAGAFMLLLALVFLLWALLHQRRSRGPRRKSIAPPKQPRMPKLPRQKSYRVRKPKAVTQTKGRRSIRRMTVVLPTVLIGSLALGGCSTDLFDDFNAEDLLPSPSASPSPSAVTVEEIQPPTVTVGQIESIVRDVSEVAENADASLDADELAERFAGPALELRASNYEIRSDDSSFAALPVIPSGPVEVSLPQQLPRDADAWPRTAFAVVSGADDDENAAPIALTLIQETPRSMYKVHYAVTLEPDVVIPPLAPEGVGAPRLGPESRLLSLAPGELLPAYIDVLNSGADSDSFDLFDVENDGFVANVGVEAREAREEALDEDAAIEFSVEAGDAETIALATNESGALVSVYVTETETVTPVEDGATINPEGATKTLSGVTGSETGVTATYGDQLLFSVPPVGSDEKIVLLGFSQGLISAQEIP